MKLEVSTCVVLLCLALSAEGKRHEHANSNKTRAKADGEDLPIGSSRLEFGTPYEKVWPWHGIAWRQQPLPKDAGKMAGYLIRLSKTHFILSEDTFKRLQSGQTPTNTDPAEHDFHPPNKVHHLQNTNPNVRLHDIHAVKFSLGGTPFGVYRLANPHPKAKLDSFDPDPKIYPKLEENKREDGTDCYAYGWSVSKANGAAYEPGYRYYHRFPVKKSEIPCKNNGALCYLYVHYNEALKTFDGAVCQIYDDATPVLCGPEQKLTYLMIGEGNKGFCKLDAIRGYKVAYMYDDIQRSNRTVP